MSASVGIGSIWFGSFVRLLACSAAEGRRRRRRRLACQRAWRRWSVASQNVASDTKESEREAYLWPSSFRCSYNYMLCKQPAILTALRLFVVGPLSFRMPSVVGVAFCPMFGFRLDSTQLDEEATLGCRRTQTSKRSNTANANMSELMSKLVSQSAKSKLKRKCKSNDNDDDRISSATERNANEIEPIGATDACEYISSYRLRSLGTASLTMFVYEMPLPKCYLLYGTRIFATAAAQIFSSTKAKFCV